MLWFYVCPQCRRELNVDWPSRLALRTCQHCRREHFAPAPAEDVEAYVSGHRWPPELEQAVVTMNGKTCAVPGCFREYKRITHRVPVERGGRTAVANLVALCAEHLDAKGDCDWEEWLATLKVKEHEGVVAGLETLADLPSPGMLDGSNRFPTDSKCHALAGWVRVPDGTPPGMRLLAARPFICGPVRRLVLNYGWRRQTDGTSEVALIAWPRGQALDLGRGNGSRTVLVERRHAGRAGDAGSSWLELTLPDADGDCWVAAIALTDESGRIEMEDCLLAGVE